MKKEPAFPEVTSEEYESVDAIRRVWSEGGLTKRELIAAMLWRRELDRRDVPDFNRPMERAEAAVRNADALITELEKQ